MVRPARPGQEESVWAGLPAAAERSRGKMAAESVAVAGSSPEDAVEVVAGGSGPGWREGARRY